MYCSHKLLLLFLMLFTTFSEAEELSDVLRDAYNYFPDIKKNDVLTGVYKPEEGITLHHNETVVTTFNDKDFARSFFLIWLHENTSEPKLRQELLEFREDS